jgi:peptide deformylase
LSTIGEYDWYKLDRKGKKILEEVGQGKRWFIKDEVSAAVCGALAYINILKGEIDASSKNNSVFADKYKRLERELTEAKSLNKSLTQQVTDCEHKCLKLQDEYHEAIESHAGVRKNLTEEVDELKLQLRTSGEETIAFAKLLQETAKECNQAKAALNKFHDMQAEVDNLKDVNRILEQQKQDLLKYYNKQGGRKGVGLAANQLGINANVCVLLLNDLQLSLVNPQIIEHSFDTFINTEGCLSLPGISVNVKRYTWVKVKADNLKEPRTFGVDLAIINGKEYSTALFESACVQHEIQHLMGILITDL